MARLVRTLAGGLALIGLAGCATTQQRAARVQLNSARIRVAETPVRMDGANPALRVQSVALLHGRGQTAVVVQVANRSAAPVSDLPILVGLTRPGGHRVLLNRSANLDYFQSHLPLVPAHGQLSWVLTRPGGLPADARPFALVGAHASPAVTVPAQPPSITATLTPAAGGVWLRLANPSPVPQYQLQVYAVARRGRRYVAAGSVSLDQLSAGASHLLRIPLVGDSGGAQIAVEAPPTTFS